jgi:hypothetical protein
MHTRQFGPCFRRNSDHEADHSPCEKRRPFDAASPTSYSSANTMENTADLIDFSYRRDYE